MKSRLAFAFACAAALACGPRLLPGTDIREDKDTRAVYDLLGRYKQAMEARDAPAVLALTAPDYFDSGGTPEPYDDIDAAALARKLPEDLAKVDSLRLDLTLRKIEVKGDRAVAEVFYETWYRVTTPSGAVPRRDSDVHQMRFHKVNGTWLFAGGL